MADPMDFDADNLLANVYALTTRDTDLDKEEKLAKADKYAHDSLTRSRRSQTLDVSPTPSGRR